LEGVGCDAFSTIFNFFARNQSGTWQKRGENIGHHYRNFTAQRRSYRRPALTSLPSSAETSFSATSAVKRRKYGPNHSKSLDASRKPKPLDRLGNIARTKRMTDDRHDAKQAVAAAFHQMRKEAKAKREGQPQGAPMHHRANTDWWAYLPGGKKYR